MDKGVLLGVMEPFGKLIGVLANKKAAVETSGRQLDDLERIEFEEV